MKLSIAMIVKDEEKNIERTLIPLKELSQFIESEIIIVDTGSKDRTVEIASKYTDKIYCHKWNNSFSEMRNISINYCTGEWVLIVDADEVIFDVKELVSLINNKNLVKYKSAYIDIIDFKENIENTLENGSVMKLLRLFKRGTVKYVRNIHEQPESEGPLFDSQIRFLHYGYDNRDSSLMEYKFERNIMLLLKELEECPEDIYTNFQIATTYVMHGDLVDALKYIKHSYSLAYKEPYKYIYVIDKYCLILYKSEKYEELKKIAEVGIKNCDSFLDFYFYLGIANHNLNEYSSAIDAYKKYFVLLKEDNAEFIDTLSSITKPLRNKVAYNMALCYYNINNYNKALKNFLRIEDRSVIKDRILLALKVIVDGRLYRKLNVLDEFIDKFNYDIVLNYLHKEITIEDLKELYKVNDDSELGKIIEIVHSGRCTNLFNDKQIKKIEEVIKSNGILYSIYVFYLLKANRFDYDLVSMFGKEKVEEVLLVLTSSFYEVNEILEKLLLTNRNDNYNNLIVNNAIERALLLGGNISYEKRLPLFLEYIANRFYILNYIYSEEILKKYSWMLPTEDRFIIAIKKALAYRFNNKLRYIKELKKLLSIEEKSYIDLIKMLVDKESREDILVNENIKSLIPSLVVNVKQLINEGEFQDAYNTLEECLGLVKFDLELMLIKYDLLQKYNYENEANNCFKEIILYGDYETIVSLLRKK